jgi:hypothetical protein
VILHLSQEVPHCFTTNQCCSQPFSFSSSRRGGYPRFHMPCQPGSKHTNDGSTPKRYQHKLQHGGMTGEDWKQARLQGKQSKTVTFTSPNSQKDTSSPNIANSISHTFPSDTITTESASMTFYTCRAYLTFGLSPSVDGSMWLNTFSATCSAHVNQLIISHFYL